MQWAMIMHCGYVADDQHRVMIERRRAVGERIFACACLASSMNRGLFLDAYFAFMPTAFVMYIYY